MLSKTLYWTGRLTVNSYARTMLRLDVQYRAALPAGAKIIAANHPTTIDPFVSTILAKEQAHILISETLFKVPVFSSYLRHSGHVMVVMKEGRAAFNRALELLQVGKTVVIFPEGALSPRGGGLGQLHTGVARLALLTGAPVIPVGIGLMRERIRYIKMTIDEQVETAHWYFSGPYAITTGVPLYFKGDVDNHDFVSGVTDQIEASISFLARQSERRIRDRQATLVERRAETRRRMQGHLKGLKMVLVRSGSKLRRATVNTSR